MSRLLLVDDDRDIPELLAGLLSDEGHQVRVAHDGTTGLQMMREQLPDAILLDVEMPKLTGPEVAYRMLVEDAGMERVPVVLVSGVADLEAVASHVGTRYFIGKPFDFDRLLDLLELALTERSPPAPSP